MYFAKVESEGDCQTNNETESWIPPEGDGCSYKCDGVKYDPICGDDGVTYNNKCHMMVKRHETSIIIKSTFDCN